MSPGGRVPKWSKRAAICEPSDLFSSDPIRRHSPHMKCLWQAQSQKLDNAPDVFKPLRKTPRKIQRICSGFQRNPSQKTRAARGTFREQLGMVRVPQPISKDGRQTTDNKSNRAWARMTRPLCSTVARVRSPGGSALCNGLDQRTTTAQSLRSCGPGYRRRKCWARHVTTNRRFCTPS
jgi:hypothetical protein